MIDKTIPKKKRKYKISCKISHLEFGYLKKRIRRQKVQNPSSPSCSPQIIKWLNSEEILAKSFETYTVGLQPLSSRFLRKLWGGGEQKF